MFPSGRFLMDEISLSISVDLEASAASKRPDPAALARTVEQLVELLGSEGVAATWVAGDLQSSELIVQYSRPTIATRRRCWCRRPG